MKYHFPSCDLFLVGASSDVYRLNLERGQFQVPYKTNSASINKCEISNIHGLLFCGTQDGTVEAWDPRTKSLVGRLDCTFSCLMENNRLVFYFITDFSQLHFNYASFMEKSSFR